MKKLLILIPNVTLLAACPLISSVSCSNIEDKYFDYKIMYKDMKDIISLKDVEFLQSQWVIVEDGIEEATDQWMSPTVYHYYSLLGDSYVYYDNNWQLWEISRAKLTDPWSEPTRVDETYFAKPSTIGQIILSYYEYSIQNHAVYKFDNKTLSYRASFTENNMPFNMFFNFYKNKLTNFSYAVGDDENMDGQTITLLYKEVTPDVPSIRQ